MLNAIFSNAGQYWFKVCLVWRRKPVCSWWGMYDHADQYPSQVDILSFVQFAPGGFLWKSWSKWGVGSSADSVLSWHVAQWRSTASRCMGMDQSSSSSESGLSRPAPPWHHWLTPTPAGLMHFAHWGQRHSSPWTVWCWQESWHQFPHKSARRFLPRSLAGR